MTIPSNPKRAQILRTGKDLFWKFGIRRVTIEEICKEAGVSKMTYYKFFSNKTDLVKSIMDGIYNDSVKDYRSLMDSDLPFTEKVIRTIQMKRESIKTISNEFFQDLVSHPEPELASYMERIKNENVKMISDYFTIAQKKGEIRKDIKVDFINYFMNHMLEMSHDKNLVMLYDNPQELIMELTNFMFYGLLDREVHTEDEHDE